MFLFSSFSELDVSHTPDVRRKELLHLAETAPFSIIFSKPLEQMFFL